jgi:6-phosphogluconolactonase
VTNLPNHWTLFDDAEQLAQATVESIIQAAQKSIAARDSFHLVTAGGTTPNRCYELLAQRNDQAWSKWFIYLGDERVLPEKDPERNSQSLYQAWLSKVNIPKEQIFFIPTEQGMEQAAEAYKSIVDHVDLFDLVLLGMGEDGHTASLFPGHSSLFSQQSVVCESDSPKPPLQRVSLSRVRLQKTRKLIKLISGKNKHLAVQAWLSGISLPIKQVKAPDTQVFIDHQAWLGH